MSDWLLYHGWGIRGYQVVGGEKVFQDTILLSIEPRDASIRCPRCNSRDVVRKGSKQRLFLGTPIGRRRVYFEATDQLQKDVLKGTRWLLLKRMDNLDDEKREADRLLAALKLNESLAIAYYLREDLSQFWEQRSKAAAERFLDDWIETALGTGIRLVMKFARTLLSRRQSLLNWHDYPISTGPLEAVNNKIRLLHRQAFGYREPEFFQLKLFALHNARYALVG